MKRVWLTVLLLLCWTVSYSAPAQEKGKVEYLECTTGACKFRIDAEELWLKPKGIHLPSWGGGCWAELFLSKQVMYRLDDLFSRAGHIEVSEMEGMAVPVASPWHKGLSARIAKLEADGKDVAESLDHGLGVRHQDFLGEWDGTWWCRGSFDEPVTAK